MWHSAKCLTLLMSINPIMTPLDITNPILKTRKPRLYKLSDFPNNCNGCVVIWRSIIRSKKIFWNEFIDKKLIIMNTKTRKDGHKRFSKSC